MIGFKPFLLTGLLLVSGSMASAAPTYEITHSGDVNPQTEGWRAIDIVASTVTEFTLPRPGIGPVTDGTVDAWQVSDPVTSPSETSAYWATGIGGGNVLLSNHWQFTANVKALPTDGTANARLNSAFRIMAFSRNYFNTQLGTIWLVTLEDLAADGTRIRIQGDDGNAVDITVSDDYHWLDMIYDPATGADFYVDGQLVQSNVASSGYAPVGNRVEFGDLQLVNGGSGGANWASVSFAYDDEPFSPVDVPEPASAVLLLGGAIMSASRRRH